MGQLNSVKEQECVEQAERILELESVLKEIEDENEQLKSKYEKDFAITNQKLEFL